MFDLAINKTLEKNPSCRPNSSSLGAPTFPIPEKEEFCDFFRIREGVSKFCSLLYSGGLSRDLNVIIR
ncbi:hypothetical protein GQ457_16G021480 [Hibiscus cannabinus]